MLSRNNLIKEIPKRLKTIKVDAKVWNSLKSKKRENETFNDVIKELLMQRTQSIGNENIQAIKYKRKIGFFTNSYGEDIGFEFEYNDVKSNKDDFVLDVKIRKIFFRKKSYSPSQFFGIDNQHKHYSSFFIEIYFSAVELALYKEFRIKLFYNSNDLTYYKHLYYEYELSEESFKEDIEEPMRLIEDDKPPKFWKNKIDNSVAKKFEKEVGLKFD